MLCQPGRAGDNQGLGHAPSPVSERRPQRGARAHCGPKSQTTVILPRVLAAARTPQLPDPQNPVRNHLFNSQDTPSLHFNPQEPPSSAWRGRGSPREPHRWLMTSLLSELRPSHTPQGPRPARPTSDTGFLSRISCVWVPLCPYPKTLALPAGKPLPQSFPRGSAPPGKAGLPLGAHTARGYLA